MSTATIRIDGREVTLAPGMTVLAAARELGLDIPTLCHLEKCGPLTSQFSRLPSDVRMNAPLRVPTRTRTLLMPLLPELRY